jgi:ubiquinone/menaquinone biosynthesis C-methylase UbiE
MRDGSARGLLDRRGLRCLNKRMSTLPVANAGPWEKRTCPICESTSANVYVAFDALCFSQCGMCGVVYKSLELPDLRPKGFYEKGYYTHKRSRRLKRFEHRCLKAQKLIRNALEFIPARSLLDVGCAVGEVVEAGQRLGIRAAGCDISNFAVKFCNDRQRPAKLGSLEQLPTPNASVDLIVLKHVLEHTPDPKTALAEVRRALTNKGGVLIAVPDLTYWKGLWQRRQGRYFRPDALGRQHFVYYSVATLVRLLESSGFEVCARSKAVFRKDFASQSVFHALAESLRFAMVGIWVWVAPRLHLRREVVVIARQS